MTPEQYDVIGMMSGTSLDGMDVVLCRFTREHGTWQFRIDKSVTYEYSSPWKKSLQDAGGLNAEEFLLLHDRYGRFIGEKINQFCADNQVTANLVASHGHTIFHQPWKKFTFQLGAGASIASTCKMTTVSDFRTMDVAWGGQGAPLVPVGDELLFSRYAYCLNLGGFGNISNRRNGIRVAFDICPVNIVLNALALRTGREYDRDGDMGRQGLVNASLVRELNDLPYYSETGPKSLGREWVENHYMPVLDRYVIPLQDMMCSVYEHIAYQIGTYLNQSASGDVLVTGGGAFNTFLIERITRLSKPGLIIPDEKLVKFKEALIFALLGLLRYRNEINCLASVTGASRDSSSGIIHLV
jgi:anhydro-N-acetylmuramic acid kinase